MSFERQLPAELVAIAARRRAGLAVFDRIVPPQTAFLIVNMQNAWLADDARSPRPAPFVPSCPASMPSPHVCVTPAPPSSGCSTRRRRAASPATGRPISTISSVRRTAASPSPR